MPTPKKPTDTNTTPPTADAGGGTPSTMVFQLIVTTFIGGPSSTTSYYLDEAQAVFAAIQVGIDNGGTFAFVDPPTGDHVFFVQNGAVRIEIIKIITADA